MDGPGIARPAEWIVAVMSAVAALLMPGCETPPTTDGKPPPIELTAEQLIERHNARAAKLDELHAYGVIEIWWTDDSGRHFEQGDAELWIDQPSRTALRVSHDLADELLWLGSNEQSWWLFDLTAKPTTLVTGELQTVATRPVINGAAPVHPLVLLDLLGITAVDVADGAAADFDPEARRWVVDAQGRGGAVRLHFDEQGQRPVRVDALGEQGDMIAHSTLRDYESAKLPGVNLLNWPKLATQYEIKLTDDTGRIVLSFNNDMSATLAGQPAEAVFDLERLKHSLQPEVVETPAADPQDREARAATGQ